MSTPFEQVLMRRKKDEMVQFLNDHPEYFEVFRAIVTFRNSFNLKPDRYDI